MPGPAAILRDLHRLQRHARDLRDQIDRGPATLKAQEYRVARQEQILREAQEFLKKLKVEIHQKEVTLKGKQQQIAKHERQLNESTAKKEYDALKAEIAADSKACQKLEDEILDAMGEVEARTAQLPETERAVVRAKEEAARAVNDIQTRRHQLTEQLAEVHKQLQEIEAGLPDEVKAHYVRLLAAKGEDALAAVGGRSCTACYTDVTAQNYNELTREQFVVCKSCGRILYLQEG